MKRLKLKSGIQIFCGLLILSGPPVIAQTSVLFHFESGSVAEWDYWSFGSEVVAQTTVVHSGTYAMRYKHTEGESRYATAWAAPSVTHWSGAGAIGFWARSDVETGTNTVKLQFEEQGGEVWVQKEGTVLTRSFQHITAALDKTKTNGFEVSFGVNWTLDLDSVTNVTLIFDAQTNHAPYEVYYFVDDVELLPAAQVVTLNLSTGQVHFGTVNPSLSDHRYLSGATRVDYEVTGYSEPWRMEIYSTHASGQAGIVGEDNANYVLPLKCWYGPTNFIPQDPEASTNWANSYSFVTDETNTWHPTLAVSTNSPIGTGFNIYFATDATGVYMQDYSTTVMVELMFE